MHFVDDPLDVLRLILIALSFWCFYTLIKRYRQGSEKWNVKTMDYWYSLLMWSIVGFSLPLQGIVLDRPLTPILVITTAAVMVTGKGLHGKGSWGSDST